MISFIINAFKIIFLLGFLVFIHEGGHFIVAKLCKVKVNEFAIGFGPTIWKKQGKETKYAIRLIPLGGFVNLEGEDAHSDAEGSFTNASIPKRMAIILAGGLVNIIFGLVVYFILIASIQDISYALTATKDFIFSIGESLKELFSGNVSADQMMGPVGISEVVISTQGIKEFIYLLALVSVSLGVTNLLPFPALDGGKFVLLVLELIRGKKLKEQTEINLTLLGFTLLIALSIYITYNDITRII